MKCSHCHSSENLLKYNRSYHKDGTFKQYYYCRECNTKRLRSYRKTNSGKKTTYEASSNYNKRHSDRVKAWSRVNLPFYKFLKTKVPCYCGEVKVDGHHPNPLEKTRVVWLCRLHHKRVHATEIFLQKYYVV